MLHWLQGRTPPIIPSEVCHDHANPSACADVMDETLLSDIGRELV